MSLFLQHRAVAIAVCLSAPLLQPTPAALLALGARRSYKSQAERRLKAERRWKKEHRWKAEPRFQAERRCKPELRWKAEPRLKAERRLKGEPRSPLKAPRGEWSPKQLIPGIFEGGVSQQVCHII